MAASLAHPRDIFRPAIANLTAGLIFVHNHPSGDPEPSQTDLNITRRLSEVGRVVGIRVLDHVGPLLQLCRWGSDLTQTQNEPAATVGKPVRGLKQHREVIPYVTSILSGILHPALPGLFFSQMPCPFVPQ